MANDHTKSDGFPVQANSIQAGMWLVDMLLENELKQRM